MRAADDNLTQELPGIKPPPVTKKRGRPRVHADAAARQRAYAERKGLAKMTVELPPDLLAEFEAWLLKKGERKSDVIVRLLRTQLLRKR